MQLASRLASTGPQTTGSPLAIRLNHLVAVGVVMAGAGVLTAGPAVTAAADIQHRAVHLLNTSDWSEVLATAQQNIDVLQAEYEAAPNAALTQIAANQQDYAQLITGMEDVQIGFHGDGSAKTITSGFEGFTQGWDQMLHGFDSHPDIPGLLDLPQAMLASIQAGDPLQAFSDFDNWLLDSAEIMIKPLAPIITIPERMLENYTSVMNDMFGPESLWDFGKGVTKAFSEPMLGAGFQFSEILGVVQADITAGDWQGAFTTLGYAPAQLTDALLNGYDVPETGKSFIGLLTAGGTLENLLVIWPQRIAEDLTVGTADLPTHATDMLGSGAETLLGMDLSDFLGLF